MLAPYKFIGSVNEIQSIFWVLPTRYGRSHFPKNNNIIAEKFFPGFYRGVSHVYFGAINRVLYTSFFFVICRFTITVGGRCRLNMDSTWVLVSWDSTITSIFINYIYYASCRSTSDLCFSERNDRLILNLFVKFFDYWLMFMSSVLFQQATWNKHQIKSNSMHAI